MIICLLGIFRFKSLHLCAVTVCSECVGLPACALGASQDILLRLIGNQLTFPSCFSICKIKKNDSKLLVFLQARFSQDIFSDLLFLLLLFFWQLSEIPIFSKEFLLTIFRIKIKTNIHSCSQNFPPFDSKFFTTFLNQMFVISYCLSAGSA